MNRFYIFRLNLRSNNFVTHRELKSIRKVVIFTNIYPLIGVGFIILSRSYSTVTGRSWYKSVLFHHYQKTLNKNLDNTNYSHRRSILCSQFVRNPKFGSYRGPARKFILYTSMFGAAPNCPSKTQTARRQKKTQRSKERYAARKKNKQNKIGAR